MRLRTLLAVAVVAGLVGGCRRPTGPVVVRKPTVPAAGKLTFRGQPAVGARITFVPVQPDEANPYFARGEVGPDGTYTLTTYDDGDGAPPGEYHIAVIWRDQSGAPEREVDGNVDFGKDKLHPDYSDPSKSQLRRTVADGKPQLEPIALK